MNNIIRDIIISPINGHWTKGITFHSEVLQYYDGNEMLRIYFYDHLHMMEGLHVLRMVRDKLARRGIRNAMAIREAFEMRYKVALMAGESPVSHENWLYRRAMEKMLS